MTMMTNMHKLAVVYRKFDGKIVRACTLLPNLVGRVSEKDVDKFLPGVDTSQLGMVFVEGKQYLDINRYKVQIDVNGEFVDIVEKEDVLNGFSGKGVEVNEELLHREVPVIISVLSTVADDKERLAKYKELEQQGRNRVELINFFKQQGV